MISVRKWAVVSVSMVSLTLAGCGGGGGDVASTPPPTPTPTPTGPVNADLLGPLKSESFANLAVHGSANFDGTTVKGSTASQTATIRYDAATQSYSLSTTSGKITFAPTDIDSSLTSAGATAYVRKSGSVTDSLTLTKPGTSGRFTYKYVGSAFWQHTNIGNNSGSGTVDAFVYGAPTPDAAIPRSGNGFYDIDLLGTEAFPSGVAALAGQGGASVDFAKGKMRIDGTMNGVYLSGMEVNFVGDLTLASANNRFSGNIAWADADTFAGTVDGQFFGPASEELGATFRASATDGRLAVGTLTGRQQTGTNTDLVRGPSKSQAFVASGNTLTFTSKDGIDNQNTVAPFSGQAIAAQTATISYNAATGRYTLTLPDRTVTLPRMYAALTGMSFDQELILSFGSYYGVASYGLRSGKSYRFDNLVFGLPTADAAVVRSGSAAYLVNLSGYAIDNRYSNRMSVGGQAALRMDLASGAMTLAGKIGYSEDYVMAGRARINGLGTLTGSGTLSANANAFSGTLAFNGLGAYAGSFTGQLFGPAGQEVAATWQASDGNAVAQGWFGGARDDSLLVNRTLAGAIPDTDFASARRGDMGNLSSGDAAELRYDAAARQWTYVTKVSVYGEQPRPITFGQGDIVAAQSDASKTAYENDGMKGYVFTSGASNPTLALSYVSFADISVKSHLEPGTLDEQSFVYFGFQTPKTILPVSGTASYSGTATGHAKLPSMGFTGDVAGRSAFVVDFGANTVNLNLALHTVEPTARDLPAIASNASLNGNSFYGAMEGALFGPNANEIAALWSYYQYHDDIARTDTITGVAVAKKN